MGKTNKGTSRLERLLSLDELANYLGVPAATIYDWRTHGKGPLGIRIGKHVRFAESDVAEWLASQREERIAAIRGGDRR